MVCLLMYFENNPWEFDSKGNKFFFGDGLEVDINQWFNSLGENKQLKPNNFFFFFPIKIK